jgi:hypothetical protein
VGRAAVTVVQVRGGRFAILMLDPTEPEHVAVRKNDPHGYTEAELRRVLASCYRLSAEETDKRRRVASLQNAQCRVC